MSAEQDPNALLEGVNEKLRNQWQQHRRQAFNPNTKGAAYETTLKNFLLEYFKGVYHIRTRAAVIDRHLDCFEVFNAGENEFDVVGSFRQAIPELVFESGEMKWVTFEGIAFVCEVKSELNNTSLESDLEKLAKLKTLEYDNPKDRFPNQYGGTRMYIKSDGPEKKAAVKTTVEHQLKCLVYDNASISETDLRERIQTDPEIWDLLLVVDENVLFVSPNLPFTDSWYKRFNLGNLDEEEDGGNLSELLAEELPAPALPDGFTWFVLLIAISIPHPRPFDVSAALIALVQKDWDEEANYPGFASLD